MTHAGSSRSCPTNNASSQVFYSEKEARDLVYVLLDAVHHMHSHNIVHRDLKPEK